MAQDDFIIRYRVRGYPKIKVARVIRANMPRCTGEGKKEHPDYNGGAHTPSEAVVKIANRFPPKKFDLVEVMTDKRYRELKEMKAWLKSNAPTTRMKQTEHTCYECRRKMKRKVPKYKFRRFFKDGRRRVRFYCEDCVDDIPAKVLEELVFVKVL